MFQHLVVALDGSKSSLNAFDTALDLASRAGAQMDLVSVAEELPRYSSAREESEREREAALNYYRNIQAEPVRRARSKHVSVHTEILTGHEAQAVMDFALARRADLIVIGGKGHSGVMGILLGGTAGSIVTHAPCSVLVNREEAEMRWKRVLVAQDGSPSSRQALQLALELAKLFYASLTALCIVEGAPTSSNGDRVPASVRQLQEATLEQAYASGTALQVATRGGHAAEAIVDFARQGNYDLIVAGATGLERPWSATAGGTAQRIAQEAPCAVMLVRPLRLAQRVKDVMTRGVTAATLQTPLATVAELLIRRGVKAVPVIDEQERVVGIITGGDLLARGNLGLRLSLLREPTLDSTALHEQLHALATSGKRAREIMTPDPQLISADADLQDAINQMARHNIKRLPVVDAERRLVGILARADVLRAVAAAPESAEVPTSGMPNASTVGELMTREVESVAPDAPSEVVLRAVLQSPHRRVVVVDADGHVSGIITDRNLLAQGAVETRVGLVSALTSRLSHRATERLAQAERDKTAADMMDAVVFTVRADESLLRAIQLMMQHQVKRLVVVDQEDRLQGLIDRQQILRSLTGMA
jgi:nucleotide-binding universal stress UspA family protein/CBS domain-containing protein